ncbi:MAG: hypothetical protein ACLU0O_10025 [Collinsella sp.]
MPRIHQRPAHGHQKRTGQASGGLAEAVAPPCGRQLLNKPHHTIDPSRPPAAANGVTGLRLGIQRGHARQRARDHREAARSPT